MQGYNYYSGFGGAGAQQAGGISPSLHMMDATTGQAAPQDLPMNPLATGGYAQQAPAPGFGSATPAQQAALGSNATNVNGFGYINNNWLNGGNTLNGLGGGNFTSAQIAAINGTLGGQHFGLNAGSGLGQGALANYGFSSGTSGAGGLGDSYQVGGQQYTPDQLQKALTGFNSQLNTIPDYIGLGGAGKDINYGSDWFHGGGDKNGFTSLGSVYDFLRSNPGFQNYGTGGMGSLSAGQVNPFAAYYNDPTMTNSMMATMNSPSTTGGQKVGV